MSQSRSLFSGLFDHSWAFSHSPSPLSIHTPGLNQSDSQGGGGSWRVQSSTVMPLVLFVHFYSLTSVGRAVKMRLEECNVHRRYSSWNSFDFERFKFAVSLECQVVQDILLHTATQKKELLNTAICLSPLALIRNLRFSRLTPKCKYGAQQYSRTLPFVTP